MMIPVTNSPSDIRSAEARGGVHGAIAAASRKTGVDFSYLLGQAQIESGLRTDVRASTSSATGLYQFIDQSWLSVVKQHGQEHGIGWASDAIQRSSSGRLTVTDPAMRQAILDLRKNPEVASVMAAEHAADNKAVIEGRLGREANGTDLYMAHFLGVGGAVGFLSAMEDNPNRTAASLFPAAARSNRNIFFSRDGSAKSLADIYQRFSEKLGNGVQLAGNNSPGVAGRAAGPRLDTATLNRLELARINQDQVAEQNLLRPSPNNARLAYMMLASLGN